MRGIYGICLFVFAVTIGGAACAEPLPMDGTASYQGELGDLISMRIDLDDGYHIEILRDPMTLIGRQIASGVSDVIPPDDGPPESLRLLSCKTKAEDCTPFDGSLVIQSVNDHAVTGYVTLPGHIMDAHAFSARLVHYQNPLLTGGLIYHSASE